ncbi:MAG: hypothetical protein RL338_1928 [Chloroflexota bacterium]
MTVPAVTSGRPALDETAAVVMASVARTFDLASRLLPGDVRRDVRRLYLVMRTLDDMVDHGDPRADAAIELVERWAAGGPADGELAPILADLAARFPSFPRDAVADFCAGMRADRAGVRHATDVDMDRYCYAVAGTVGRMMAAVLGVIPGREGAADVAARRLGAAMQRTNILRDLVADARAGRAYIPDETFVAAGFPPAEVTDEMKLAFLADLPHRPAALRRAIVGREIALADADYAAGLAGIGALRRGRRSIAAAGHLYREILRQIERDGHGATGRRAVVSRPRKALIVARTSLGGAR